MKKRLTKSTVARVHGYYRDWLNREIHAHSIVYGWCKLKFWMCSVKTTVENPRGFFMYLPFSRRRDVIYAIFCHFFGSCSRFSSSFCRSSGLFRRAHWPYVRSFQPFFFFFLFFFVCLLRPKSRSRPPAYLWLVRSIVGHSHFACRSREHRITS